MAITARLVRDRVKHLRTILSAESAEEAHAFEDGLHRAILREIASGTYTKDEAAALASAALETDAIRFARSY